MPIALDLPKCQTWPNQKPEVDWQRCGHDMDAIFKNLHNVMSVSNCPIGKKFGKLVLNHMPMTVRSSK